MYDILQLNDMLVPELVDIASGLKIPHAVQLEKQDLIYKILDKQALLESAAKGGQSTEKPKRKRILKTTTSMGTEEAEVMESLTPAPAPAPPPAPVAAPAAPAEAPAAGEKQAKLRGGPKKAKPRKANEPAEAPKAEQPQAAPEARKTDKPQHPKDKKPLGSSIFEAGETAESIFRSALSSLENAGSSIELPEEYEEEAETGTEEQPAETEAQVQPAKGPQQRPQQPQRQREPAFNVEFDGQVEGEGVLEMMPDGYGFLRSSDYN
jgi:transcription termination factor Rho